MAIKFIDLNQTVKFKFSVIMKEAINAFCRVAKCYLAFYEHSKSLNKLLTEIKNMKFANKLMHIYLFSISKSFLRKEEKE